MKQYVSLAQLISQGGSFGGELGNLDCLLLHLLRQLLHLFFFATFNVLLQVGKAETGRECNDGGNIRSGIGGSSIITATVVAKLLGLPLGHCQIAQIRLGGAR